MELTELLQRAQTALDKGEYRLAAAIGRHILETYPSCLSAHRLLGEACLEQGEAAAAVEHFGQALALDPLNVVARLGLGVASEENGDPEAAYRAYLQAWELNPGLDSVRDELLRLRAALGERAPASVPDKANRPDRPDRPDRLHRTRAGLAAIHAREGQLSRSVAEWRAVLAAEPESDLAQTALTEVLWRQGDDAAALRNCRQLLERNPKGLRALAIMAEIERRRGDPAALATAETYQRLDPAGEVIPLLAVQKSGDDFAWLAPTPDDLPVFDAAAAAAPAEPATGEVAAETPATVDLAATAPAHQMPALDLWDNLIRDITGELTLAHSATPHAVEPFVWSTDHDRDAAGDDQELAAVLAGADGALQAVGSSDNSVPPDGGRAVAVMDRPQAADGAPDDIAMPPSAIGLPTQPPRVDPFITADGRVDLTAGWDELDQALAAARPDTSSLAVDDPLLADLADDGIAPFDVGASTGVDDAWEPLSADDLDSWDDLGIETRSAPEPDTSFAYGPDIQNTPLTSRQPALPDVQDEEFDFGSLTANWDSVEQELAAAIPADSPSGYTEVLRNLGVEHLQPFEPGDEDARLAAIDQPDVAGEPLAFDELVRVAGADELFSQIPAPTMPLMRDPIPRAAADSALAELEPFSFDDVAPFTGDDDFDFSVPDTQVPTVREAASPWPASEPAPEASTLPTDPPMVSGRWPSFVAATSELVDRFGEVGALFARLREEKQALVGLGMLHTDRSLRAVASGTMSTEPLREPTSEFDLVATTTEALFAARSEAVDESLAETEPAEPGQTEPVQAGPAEWAPTVDAALVAEAGEIRRRMRLGDAETGELVESLTARFTGAEGEQPLARLLGEAYLALGRSDLAAAHFRAARSWRVAAR